MSELGHILQQARLEQGFTLDDIQEKTKIQKRYLQAIEEGRYEVLPGKFYIRAFVKSYAEVLGLPITPLFQEYAQELDIHDEPQDFEYVTPPKKSWLSSIDGKWIPRFLVILFFVIVGSVIYYYADDLGQLNKNQKESTVTSEQTNPSSMSYQNYTKDDPKETSAPKNEEVVKEEPLPVTVQLAKQEDKNYYYEVHGADQIQVVLKPTLRDVWMAIKEGKNGKSVEDSFTAKQNQSYTFDFPQGSPAYFHLGNAKEIELTVNGVTIDTSAMPINLTYWHFQLVPDEENSKQ